MKRVLLNPVFDIETGTLLQHDGESYVEEFSIRCDRSIAKTAGSNAASAGGTAGGFGATAAGEESALVPGLERDANTPTGFTAQQKNNMLVAGAEGVGGTGAGATGAASLTAARTKNAGGFADALDEAARIRGRQTSQNALGVQNADAQLAQEKQQEARKALQGLYGTDTSNQLKAMGLQNEDLNSQLAAKRQGWLQDTEGVINTISGAAKGAGSMGVGFGQGQTWG
jgi:hypothetical protein